jgi:1,4-alpha-glucan branching enzyme
MCDGPSVHLPRSVPSSAARWLALGALCALGAAQHAALGDDGVVQGGSLSHSWFTDRRPLCPLGGQSFTVEFQSARGDLTGARVAVDEGADGAGVVWVPASIVRSVGPYDVWRATVPATSAGSVAYVIEASDGASVQVLSAAGVTGALPSLSGWWALDFSTLTHAPYGATPATLGATAGTVFRVWAPGATSAQVRGTFNAWGSANPMTRRGEDYIAWVPGARPGQKYKFYFNGNLWKPDPRGRHLDNADNYNTLIVDPLAYAWRFPDFSPAPRDRWVVYQLHVPSFSGLNDPAGSFTRQGTFRDVAARAGHLQQLGVNAVLLNPINEFPGSSSGGYNTITSWAFESSMGSPDDLKFMIDELHARGIAVLLDVVWNHHPGNDNFLWNFDGTQSWFDTPAVGTPWGSQVDFDKAPVRQYFIDSVEHVLGEFRFDGLRHDAVFEMTGATQAVAGQQMIRAANGLIARRFADSASIAEIYDNSAWNTRPTDMNFTGQYHERYKNAIIDATFAAASGNPDMARLAGAIPGSGTWVEGQRVLNYFELHDDAWPLNNNARAVKDIDTIAPHDDRFAIGRTKLANAVTLLARGMPAILMGNEWLEDNGWETQKIDWSHKNTYAGVFRFYQDIIRLRTTEAPLFADAPASVYHVNDSGNVLAFERFLTGGGSFVVVANFSNIDYTNYLLGIPRAGTWAVEVNSDDSLYQGRGLGLPTGCLPLLSTPRDGKAQSALLSLPAHSVLVLRHNPTSGSPCLLADIAGPGQTIGCDRQLTADDIIVFVNWFFGADARADISGSGQTPGADGQFTADDLIVFINRFFAGCG